MVAPTFPRSTSPISQGDPPEPSPFSGRVDCVRPVDREECKSKEIDPVGNFQGDDDQMEVECSTRKRKWDTLDIRQIV